MKPLPLSLMCATLLAAAPIADACTLDLTLTLRSDGNSKRVTWAAVPGATQYDVFGRATGQEFRQIDQVEPKTEPFFTARPTSTEAQAYEYLILARSGNSDVSCVGTTRFEMNGDAKLATLTHKRIVPLVGSVRGANGSDFRTSLTLRHWPLVSGRIVFRPTGTLPSDNDPSLPYAFGDNGPTAHDLYWEDVVAAMGASGTGTLEVIPNVRAGDGQVIVPEIYARVYNVTPAGTFGSRVASVHPSSWFRNPEGNASYTIPPVHGNFRRNAGIRTLTTLLYEVQVQYANGETERSAVRELPAGYTLFGSVEALVGGPVPPDARISVSFLSGSAIGFYTETENATNDPTVVIKDPEDVAGIVSWSF